MRLRSMTRRSLTSSCTRDSLKTHTEWTRSNSAKLTWVLNGAVREINRQMTVSIRTGLRGMRIKKVVNEPVLVVLVVVVVVEDEDDDQVVEAADDET